MGEKVSQGWDQEILGMGMLVKGEGRMEEGKKREKAYELGMRGVRDQGVNKSMWYIQGCDKR